MPRGEGGRAAWPVWGGGAGDGGHGCRVRDAGAHTGEDGVGSRDGLDEVEVVEDGEHTWVLIGTHAPNRAAKLREAAPDIAEAPSEPCAHT